LDITDNVNRYAVLATMTLGGLLTPLMGSSITVALPTIGKEFELNAVALSWVAASYLLSASMFLVPFGRIADIYGRKRIFKYGTLLYTIGSLLSALSHSVGALITYRVIQGIGGSMIFGTSVAIITSVFPSGERGKAIGINTSAVYLGLSIGPFLGGFMTEYFGWRSLFLLNFFIGIVIIILYSIALKGEWAESKGEKIDFIGSGIYGISLVLLMYGFSRLPSTVGFSSITGGIIGLLFFFRLESRIPNPVINITLFKTNHLFTYSNIAAFINYAATSATGFLMSLYLQYIKGFSPQDTGLILVTQPIVMMVFSAAAGWLSDKIESRIIASFGMIISAASLLLFIFITENSPLYFIISALALLGFGIALFASPNTNAIMSSVEKKYYGVASATVGTMRLTGQMISIGIATLIFSLLMGTAQISPENHGAFLESIKTAFSIFAVLCFIGIFASLARGNKNKN